MGSVKIVRSFQSLAEPNRIRQQDIRPTRYIVLLGGLAATIAIVVWQGASDLVTALRAGGWALLLLVPLHLLPLLPDASGWDVLIDGHQSLRRLFRIAWIRQAVGRLMPVASIGGELVGIRLLMHEGVAPPIAVASVVVEVLSTLLSQLIFVLIGVLCLVQAGGGVGLIKVVLIGLASGLLFILLLLFFLRRVSIFGRLHRIAFDLIGRDRGLTASDLGDRIDEAIRVIVNDMRRLSLSTALQLLAMLVGSLEIWAAFAILSHPISLPEAVLVESLNQAAKHIMFFVPGALGVQEVTFIALSPLIGVSKEVALAVSLAKRGVDLIVGVPALLSWQWSEGRRWSVPSKRT
jgi:putative membrane protein